MAQTWFNAKFPGKCGGCNQPYEPGFRILVDITEKDGKKVYKTVKCDACPDDKEQRAGDRKEQEAGMRSTLPQSTADLVKRCGSLGQAVALIQGSADMAAALKAAGRSPNELFLAAANACLKSRDLPTCDPASWMDSLMAAAALGIIPDPGMGPAALAYFVPRGGKVSLDLSYRGLALVAFNTGYLREVQAEVIWECEAVLGELVSLLRSQDAYLHAAGEQMRQQLLTEPDPLLSEWDRSVIAEALRRPNGLTVQWFRYQESPLRLEHHRPSWFRPPEWTQNSPLPWGCYADLALKAGGRAVTVLTRDAAYGRATRGGNVKVIRRAEGEPLRLAPAYSSGKWETTPWCRDQIEMLKKTALRDVLTGGKVPLSTRMQVALHAEVIEGEYTEVSRATSLDQHLAQVIQGGAPGVVPEPRQLEEQPDFEFDFGAEREPVPVQNPVDDVRLRARGTQPPTLFPGKSLQERLNALNDQQHADVYERARLPAHLAGIAVDDLSATDRAKLEQALAGGP